MNGYLSCESLPSSDGGWPPRAVKTWGPVDGRGHAMFGWPMEEEAKLEFTITVNWRREDGSIATTQLGTLDRGACRSAEDVGLQLADAKPILGRLQEIVVSEQLQRYCEAVRPCPRCHRRRHLKDYRCRRFDTVFGWLGVRAHILMAAVIVVNDSLPLRYRNCCPSG
jgi:hypothetical protein